jgi:PAS domain S-box-containing protein
MLPSFIKNSSALVAVVFNKEYEIKYRNDLFLSSLKHKRNTKGNFIVDYFDKAELSSFKKLTDELIKDKTKCSVEFICNNTDSSYCWEFSLQCECTEEPLIIGIAHKEQSIERKVQLSLLESEELFHAFINNSPAISWITDETGRMLMMNAAFKNSVGLTDEDVGKSLWNIFPAKLADVYYENNMKALQENNVIRFEEVSPDKQGNMRHFIVYKFPLKKRGSKKLIGGWSIDRTEYKRIQDKLLDHHVRLRQIAFLQSHEIRRPLANILGIAELINVYREEKMCEKAFDLLEPLSKSAEELDELIKKIVKKASAATPPIKENF